MKKFAFITLAFAASLMAGDVTGAYAGKGSIESTKYGGVPYTAQLTLLQDGSSVSGTLKMGGAKLLPITSGMISGSQITFAVGQNETGVLNINGAVLTGKLTSSKGDIYDVVFTKQ